MYNLLALPLAQSGNDILPRFVSLPGDLGGGWGRQVLKIFIYHAPYKFFSIFGKGAPKVPSVGKKKFSYGKRGMAAAKNYAEKTGKPMKKTKKRGY